MKIKKSQLRRIIAEEKAKILTEQKIREAVRRSLLEGHPGSERGIGPHLSGFRSRRALVQVIQGKNISIALGEYGMYVDVEGQGTYNADDVLGDLWEEMGPDGALAYLQGIASSVSVDPDSAEDFGL